MYYNKLICYKARKRLLSYVIYKVNMSCTVATQTTTFLPKTVQVLQLTHLKPRFFSRMKRMITKTLVTGKKMASHEAYVKKETNSFVNIMSKLALFNASIAKKEAKVAKKEAKVAKKDAKVAKKDAKVAKKEVKVAKKEAKVTKKDAKVAKEAKVAKKEAKVAKEAAKQAKEMTIFVKQMTKLALYNDSIVKKEAKTVKKQAKTAIKELEKQQKEARRNARKSIHTMEKKGTKSDKIAEKVKTLYNDEDARDMIARLRQDYVEHVLKV